jgi:hypothetical protein
MYGRRGNNRLRMIRVKLNSQAEKCCLMVMVIFPYIFYTRTENPLVSSSSSGGFLDVSVALLKYNFIPFPAGK